MKEGLLGPEESGGMAGVEWRRQRGLAGVGARRRRGQQVRLNCGLLKGKMAEFMYQLYKKTLIKLPHLKNPLSRSAEWTQLLQV